MPTSLGCACPDAVEVKTIHIHTIAAKMAAIFLVINEIILVG